MKLSLRHGLAALMLMGALFAGPAGAVNPDERLADPALESRARALSAQLRCMVCQNQSIDDSNAELAKDLRLIVRERLAGGDSDAAVLDYVVSRYGEFVLLKPRLEGKTLVLWGAPALLLLVGASGLFWAARRRRRMVSQTPRLSEAEAARLDAILHAQD